MVLQCAFPDAGHRELDSRYHRALREYVLVEERGRRLIVSVQLRRLWQRRVACGGWTMFFNRACHEGSVTNVSDGDSPWLAKVGKSTVR